MIDAVLRSVSDNCLSDDSEVWFINTFQPPVPTGISIGLRSAVVCAAAAVIMAVFLEARTKKGKRG